MTFLNAFTRAVAATAFVSTSPNDSSFANSTSAFVEETPRYPGVLDGHASLESQPQDWSQAIDALLRIRKLEDDWDGDGSPAPLPETIDSSIRLAQYLQRSGIKSPDNVIASVNGHVLFEYYLDGDYFELEILSPNEMVLSMVKEGASQAEMERFNW